MKVIEIRSAAQQRTVFVIEVEPDVFYGERWFGEGNVNGRVYPSWLTRERAEARLEEIKKEEQNEKDKSYSGPH